MFPIPPAVDRPLDVEEGERVFVSRFELKGVTDRPEDGIALDELADLLDGLRTERQQLSAVDDNGFTDPERVEIAAFMQKVIADPDLDMQFEDYESLVDKLRAIKERRDAGMTIGSMQEIAAAVTQYYRSAGFVLAQAFIPAQEVVDGIVVIEVLEGNLGNVLTEGNQRYSAELLANPFKKLIDSPVQGDVMQTAILTTSDLPGMSLFGVFQPGREVGTTDLVLRVQDERTFDTVVRYDNHGTRFTGPRRAFAEADLNNPFGLGDRLTGTFMKTFFPNKSQFYKAQYEAPFPFLPAVTIGGLYQRNPFDVGAELRSAGLGGDTKELQAYTRVQIRRSLDQNSAVRLAVRRSDSVTKQNSRDIAVDHLAMLEGEFSFDSLDREGRAINLGGIGFDVGLGDLLGGNSSSTVRGQVIPGGRQSGSGRFASNTFYKVFGNFSRLQKLTDAHTILVRVDGQITPKLLTSTQQYSIGGPTHVRAYNVSEFLADTAAFASLEYSVAAPGFSDTPSPFEGKTWGEILRVSFFMDYAFGQVNEPAATDEASAIFWGAGAGSTLDLPGQFTGRVQWAYPLTVDRVPGDDGQGGGARDRGKWWFDLTYQF